MVAVLLDGPCAGMTEAEACAMRRRDVEVLGYMRPDIDIPSAELPYFSLDLNGAGLVLADVAKNWTYVSKKLFWNALQERAGLDPVVFSAPQWPDAFFTLLSDFPVHVSEAYIRVWQDSREAPTIASKRAQAHKNNTATETYIEVDEDGNEHKRLKTIPPPGTPPWVEYVATKTE